MASEKLVDELAEALANLVEGIEREANSDPGATSMAGSDMQAVCKVIAYNSSALDAPRNVLARYRKERGE